MLQLDFYWPHGISVFELRQWLLDQLKEYGEPLRWAITDIRHCAESKGFRELKVEAVLIVDSSLNPKS